MSLQRVLSALKGGDGSGNFGHAGIPGKVGGSAPSGGFANATKADLMQQYIPWKDNLTSDEHSALSMWQGGTGKYKEINSYLRASDEQKKWWQKKERWQAAADGIESALQKGSLNQDTTLWRASTLPELHPKQGKALIGTKFSDKGFTATTIDENYANKFLAYGGSKSYKMKILAKAGTKGAFMDKFNDMKESEFLMPQGKSFVVVDVDKKNKVVTMELVDE